jgi:hypothetical protein
MKKILTILLALALTLSFSAPVFADLPPSTQIDGVGTTEYLDLEVYSVVVPTDGTLNFTLDPQGLLGVGLNETVDLADLNTGVIVSDGEAKVVNNSGVDLTVTVTFTGTTDNGLDDGGPTAVFKPYATSDEVTKAAVETGTANNVLLYAVPSSVNITSTAGTPSAYAASSLGYVITTSTALKFVLGAAEMQIKDTDGDKTVVAKNGTGNGTGFNLGGFVNTKADWSQFVGGGDNDSSVGVTAVFAYAKASAQDGTDLAALTGDNAGGYAGIPGLLTPPTNAALTLVQPVGFTGGANPTAKTIAKASIVENTLVIPFNFGDETLTKIALPTGTTLAAAGNYAVGANSITFSESRTTIFKGFTSATTYTITLSDSTTYTITITP